MKDYQYSFEDIKFNNSIALQPSRIAYVDESGSFGFDFSKKGTSRYYILTAIVVEIDNIDKLHSDFQEVKRNNGLVATELKSSKINNRQRERIANQLLPLDFSVVLFIVDKEQLYKDTPITLYKETFLKNINGRMYNMLYEAFPKLKIIMDMHGYPEFQASFKEYVNSKVEQLNMFNEYDFDFSDSKDEILIQIADFIGGSITHSILNPGVGNNYLELFKGKIISQQRFPNKYKPYWGKICPEDYKYDDEIYSIAVKHALDFIEKNKNDKNIERQSQIAVLQYLLNYASMVNPTQYVYADELVQHLQALTRKKIRKDFLYRRVIAPLRDNDVILASCNHGYKIPISVEDIATYLNQTTAIVGPMLNRMGKCRDIILQGTNGALDIFDDVASIKYKRFFD